MPTLMSAISSSRARLTAIAGLSLLIAAPIAAQQKNPDLAPYLIADRADEVALARSAAPANISDSATVLVLTRTGFVEAAHGTNGFTCFVARSFHGAIKDPQFWNARFRAPHCLNPQASRTILPEMAKRAEWIMAGVSPSEIAARTKSAYASHELRMPEVGAMAYMLSSRQYLADGKVNHWMPHVMFYFDKAATNKSFGAGGFDAPIIDASAGDPDSPVRIIFIPVRAWSDGSPAMGK